LFPIVLQAYLAGPIVTIGSGSKTRTEPIAAETWSKVSCLARPIQPSVPVFSIPQNDNVQTEEGIAQKWPQFSECYVST